MTTPKDNIMSDTTKDAVPLSDAEIKACALMIKGICMTRPQEEWSANIESRIRFMLSRAPAQVQAEAVREWQSIETAPKTGRTLLLGYPNSAGKWRTVRGQWMSEAYIAEYWEEPDDAEPGWFETSEEADDVPNCWRITPTHWMPLPAAPSTGDQS